MTELTEKKDAELAITRGYLEDPLESLELNQCEPSKIARNVV
jgi:hypothetical protein